MQVFFFNVTLQDGDASGTGYSVGNDIGNLEMVRWALRTQFDRDVVTHYECQVYIATFKRKSTGLSLLLQLLHIYTNS